MTNSFEVSRAYYQEHAAVFAVDTIECRALSLRGASSGRNWHSSIDANEAAPVGATILLQGRFEPRAHEGRGAAEVLVLASIGGWDLTPASPGRSEAKLP